MVVSIRTMINWTISRTASVPLAAVLLRSAGQGTLSSISNPAQEPTARKRRLIVEDCATGHDAPQRRAAVPSLSPHFPLMI